MYELLMVFVFLSSNSSTNRMIIERETFNSPIACEYAGRKVEELQKTFETKFKGGNRTGAKINVSWTCLLKEVK